MKRLLLFMILTTSSITIFAQAKDDFENKVYEVAEKMPTYVGGMQAFGAFFSKNYRYPEAARNLGVSGRVFIQFVVEKDGLITDILVLRGVDPECDKEAVRVLKLMPKWTPGWQNGRNVRVSYTIPIYLSAE